MLLLVALVGGCAGSKSMMTRFSPPGERCPVCALPADRSPAVDLLACKPAASVTDCVVINMHLCAKCGNLYTLGGHRVDDPPVPDDRRG